MPSIFVFDAYGTLFDVHAAIARFRGDAGPDAERMSEIWRQKQLEYTWTLTLAGHYADFWTLTQRALDFALARVPTVPKALRAQLLEAYFRARRLPGRASGAQGPEGKRPPHRHPVERLARHAQRRGRRRQARQRPRRGTLRRCA